MGDGHAGKGIKEEDTAKPAFDPAKPTYDLARAQDLIRQKRYSIEPPALANILAAKIDEDDVCECVCRMTAANFKKTMPSESVPGTCQDVYNTNYGGRLYYVKIQITDKANTAIIQFKRK